MIEYRTVCSLRNSTAPSAEIENFAVIRGESGAVTGLAVSQAEIIDPVLNVWVQTEAGQLRFSTSSGEFHLPIEFVPSDALALLRANEISGAALTVYVLADAETQNEVQTHPS